MPFEDNGSSPGRHVPALANLCVGDAETPFPLRSDEDVVMLRNGVRETLLSMQFSVLDRKKMLTVVSELARNVPRYGGGEHCQVAKVSHESRPRLSMTFIDQGPGIADVSLALTAGYTTGGGMGLGLGGAKCLSDSFELQTRPGNGTTVKIIKWKPY